jgi:hypothetical protein
MPGVREEAKMLDIKQAAGEFLANRRTAVTAVSGNPKGQGATWCSGSRNRVLAARRLPAATGV